MGQPITPVSLTSPGFYGLNTQDSPAEMDQKFALDALNCVIDKSGRIASRKGWTPVNTTNIDLGTSDVECISELIQNNGTITKLAAGNFNLFKVSGTTLVTLTYGGGGSAPTITGNQWQTAVLNDCLVFFQRGHDPLVYDPLVSTTTYRRLSEKSGYVGTVPQAHSVVSAYGRLWCADTSTDKNTVTWSDIVSPHIWSTGTAGYLNLLNVWPSGGDVVVSMAAHNGKLFIFGRKQTLVYSGADDPTTMALTDTMTNVGCVVRDSIQNTGEDVIFLSDTGVRSLSRTIQENSAPTRTLSRNVNDDIQQYVSSVVPTTVKSAYSPVEGFYLLTLGSSGLTYCFDTKANLQDGSARTTVWSTAPKCYLYSQDRSLYMGRAGYVATYSNYTDNGTQYRMSYYTAWIDFGSAVRISILKKIIMTLIGAVNQPVVYKWGFDYVSGSGVETSTLLAASNPAEYGISEYNASEYNANLLTNTVSLNAGGSGRLVQIGFEAQLVAYPISIQKIDIYTKEGRI